MGNLIVIVVLENVVNIRIEGIGGGVRNGSPFLSKFYVFCSG